MTLTLLLIGMLDVTFNVTPMITSASPTKIVWYAATLESEWSYYSPIIEEFTNNTGIDVEVVLVPNWWELLQKLIDEVESGMPVADVVTIDDFLLPVAKDYVADLTEYIDVWTEWDQLYEGKREPGVICGRKYFLGWRADCVTMYVNVDKLAEYGLVWTDQNTTDDLLTVAEALYTAEGIGRLGMKAGKYEGLTCEIATFIKAYEGDYLTFNSTANVAAFELLQSLGPYLHPSSNSWDEGTIPDAIAAEEIYIDFNWPYQAVLLQEAGLSDQIRAFPNPLGSVGRGTTVGGGYLAVSKISPNMEAAWELVKFLASKRGQYLQLQHVGWLPIREDAWEELQKADPEMYELLGAYRETAKYILPRPAIPEYSELSHLWQDAFWDIVWNGKLVKATLDDYQALWEAITPPDITPPTITTLSPQNMTYTTASIALTFTVNEQTCWIGYSLDDQENVTIATNTTLTGLSEGTHSIIVYANDTSGNTGSSDTVYFTVILKTLLGTGWGWMKIDAHESVSGMAELYKIGDELIQVMVTHEGEKHSRTWNIVWHREHKHGERYLCYAKECGVLIVGLREHRLWQIWYAFGRGVVAFGFPRAGRLRLMFDLQ